MGVVVKDTRATHLMSVPRSVVAFLNRVMALPPGIHTIQLVKTGPGANGVAGWAVVEGKLEQPRQAQEN